MSTDASHGHCACGEEHGSADDDAFFGALARQLEAFGAPLETEKSIPFLVGAIQGRTMREHVNEAHPDQVEHVAGIACPTNDTREGWLFGYRYEDATTPTPTPRGGDEQSREDTGDARGGGGDAAQARGGGPGAPGYGVDDLTLEHAKLCGERRVSAGGDYLWHRVLPDGRGLCLMPMIHGGVRLGIGRGVVEFDDVWCYPKDQAGCLDAGWRAALGWNGEGEPEGWYRHPQSGRRRPGGDPAKEFVRP